MAITTDHERITGLTSEEKQKLSLLIGEMEKRGMSIPPEYLNLQHKKFPTDSAGYFVKLDGRRYLPTMKQEEFINSDARFVGLFSGRGGGKSGAGAQKALRKIQQGESGAVLGPDFENFRISTWPEFREWIPWDMVVPSHRYRNKPEWEPHQPFVMAFVNGVRVICKGLKDPDSARGPNINWLWYDEAGRDRDGLAWQIAVASVRIGNNPQSWATTTPKGRNHWLHKFFIKQDIPADALEMFEKDSEGRELVEYFTMTIHENADNLDPAFVASILANYPTGWLREQEVYGKFVDEGGVLGDPTWFNGKILPDRPDTIKKRVRYWDLAASEKKIFGKKRNDPDETVGTLLSWDGNLRFYIENQVCGHWEWMDIKEQIRRTAELDGPYIPIHIEQEPAAGGKNQVAELINYIRENLGTTYGVYGHNPKEIGDKIMRANVWFAEAAQGRFYMVQGNWNDGFLDQLSSFPEGHDDRIDSVSGARHVVAPVRMWSTTSFLSV
ncbi:MAG: phage terminase large subunit [Candidatus Kariarchaeaceae archaeon]|jgi:predicted phage terminase large subunit-like protein